MAGTCDASSADVSRLVEQLLEATWPWHLYIVKSIPTGVASTEESKAISWVGVYSQGLGGTPR